MSDLNIVESAADLSGDRAAPHNPLETRPGAEQKRAMPYVLAPEGHVVVDLRSQLVNVPPELSAKVTVDTQAAAARYLARFNDPRAIAFLDQAPKATFVLDYHSAPNEQHGAHHVVTLEGKRTEAGLAWLLADTKSFTQIAFAEFIEDQIATIAKPSGASLLDVVTNFKSHREAFYSNAVNLQNGDSRLTFSDTQSGVAANNVTLPSELTVVLAPYEGTPTIQFTVFLRFRLDGQKLNLITKVKNFQDVKRASIDGFHASVIAACKDVTIDWVHGSVELTSIWK